MVLYSAQLGGRQANIHNIFQNLRVKGFGWVIYVHLHHIIYYCFTISSFSEVTKDMRLGAAELTDSLIVRMWIAGRTDLATHKNVAGDDLANAPDGKCVKS